MINPFKRIYSFIIVQVKDPNDLSAIRCIMQGHSLFSINEEKNPTVQLTGEIIVKNYLELNSKIRSLGNDMRRFAPIITITGTYTRNFAPKAIEVPAKEFINNFLVAIIVTIVVATINAILFLSYRIEMPIIYTILLNAIAPTLWAILIRRRRT